MEQTEDQAKKAADAATAAAGAAREAARGSAGGTLGGTARAARPPRAGLDPAELGPRMGGIALKNGLILVTERHWAAAIRESDGSISVASGKKSQLPGGGRWDRPRAATERGSGAGAARRNAAAAAAEAGVPLLRGLGRFGETLVVLAQVKSHLPNAQLPLESGRVVAALAASMVGTSAVKAMAPKSGLVEEVGTALASFIPAVLALKNSAISGYHGAEHKVIGGREAALRAAARSGSGAPGRLQGAPQGAASKAVGTGASPGSAAPHGPAAQRVAPVSGSELTPDSASIVTGDSAAAAKEHDRCGSNLVGPYLLATIATNWLARGRSGQKTPLAAAAAGAASLGLALEALRWANQHGDTVLARLMLSPGRMIQKRLTTTEPTPDQLEVGERALEELMRLENAAA